MTTNNVLPITEIRAMIADLRDKYVKLERDRRLRSELDRLLVCDETGCLLPSRVRFTATGEARGLVVTDRAGGGKTSLVKHTLAKHPALQSSESRMPCVSISVPSPATMKSVGAEILAKTGYHEVSPNATAHAIWTRVSRRFEKLGTVVLWIDEAHDVFPKGAKSEAPAILKTLKSLMQGDGAVIVILSGIDSLWHSISFDEQVRRRFRPFALPEMSSAADRNVLWKILGGYCDTAGLVLPERGDLPERLVHAGRGRFGRCIEQIIDAIEVAMMRGDHRLDMQHFADVFFSQEGCSVSENVFLVPRWSSIDLSARSA